MLPSQRQNTGNPQDQTEPLGWMRQTPTDMEVYDLTEEILKKELLTPAAMCY